jgi:uncharacterized membrane protein
MLCWLLMIVIGIVSPIIFMLVGKDKPFVYRNAMQALTFSICAIIAYVISFILAFIIIGFVMMAALGIFALVVCILGAVAANRGEVYQPPLTSGFARSWFKV